MKGESPGDDPLRTASGRPMGGSMGGNMGGPTFTGSSMSMLGDVDDEDGMYGGEGCGPVEPSASDRVVGKYILRDTLGKGVEGKVKLGIDMETGEEVALKIVDLTEARRRSRQWKSVQKEIAIMTRAKHENVRRGGRERDERVGARLGAGARERESDVEGGGREPCLESRAKVRWVGC